MAQTAPASIPPPDDLIARLARAAGSAGANLMAERLLALHHWVADEMRAFESELAALPRGSSIVERSAHHLLDLDGKHLRPMCVVLASKLGTGWSESVRDLAMAVELVHTATLLHDDVIDQGEVRRSRPTARMLYGNAASIYAGDWLLIQALRRIRRTGELALLDRMLGIIDEMIAAEAVQLENRGRINADLSDYFKVVEGKTAALFRWAMIAGGTAAGLGGAEIDALERFGLHVGIAFQAVDDLLDVGGDSASTGKSLFTDLREGKMTYPMILALERRPGLVASVQQCTADPCAAPPPAHLDAVLRALDETGALDDCRHFAADQVRLAVEALDVIPDGPGKSALISVARATATRDR